MSPRICPGRHIAENWSFLIVANILSNFTISSPSEKRPDGLPLPHEAIFPPTLVSCPEPFAFDIKPRTEEHAEFVASLVVE